MRLKSGDVVGIDAPALGAQHFPGAANPAPPTSSARIRMKRPDNDRYSPFIPIELANSIDFDSERRLAVGHFIERST
jgi:hypothetical protein